MTLEDFYFISQVVAAIALVVSLIFVGLQVRQGNRLAEEASEQRQQANMIARTEFNRRQIEDINQTYQAFATDPMFLKNMPRALANETDFSPAEWTQLYFFFYSLVGVASAALMASNSRMVDDDYWPMIARGVCHLMVRPIFFEQWKNLQRSAYQTPEFYAVINDRFRELYPDKGDPEYRPMADIPEAVKEPKTPSANPA